MKHFARQLIAVCTAVGASTSAALATPYWVAWEGNDYPENDGWERFYYEPQPSIRSIENGVMTLDSSVSKSTYDYYILSRALNPGPGETFIAEWSVWVSTLISPFGFGDTGLVIAKDGRGVIDFAFLPDRIVSEREGWSVAISPGIQHQYQIISTDMVSYTLRIDGQTIRTGTWEESLNESYVAWGDTTFGGGILSVSHWDYVRFGVVPEPSSIFSMMVLAAAFARVNPRLRMA